MGSDTILVDLNSSITIKDHSELAYVVDLLGMNWSKTYMGHVWSYVDLPSLVELPFAINSCIGYAMIMATLGDYWLGEAMHEKIDVQVAIWVAPTNFSNS